MGCSSQEQLSLPVPPPQSSPPPPSHHHRHHYATDDEISELGHHSTSGGVLPLTLHPYHSTEDKYPASGHSHLTLHSPCDVDVSLQYSADSPDQVFQSSDEEIARFGTRFEEGYDIKTDARYNQWLQPRLAQPGRPGGPWPTQTSES